MNEFETELELVGAMRCALVRFEWDEGNPLIDAVEITRSERVDYDEQGNFNPHIEHYHVDITRILEQWQFQALTEEIIENDREQQDAARIERWELDQLYKQAA